MTRHGPDVPPPVRAGLRPARRTVLVGAALSGVLAASGCTSSDGDESDPDPSSSPPTPLPGDRVITANGTEPVNPLVPSATSEIGGARVVQALFAGLVTYGEGGTLRNDVARSIATQDSQVWTITLEPGREFSDGSPVTASSFVDAWSFAALATNDQVTGFLLEPVAGFDAVRSDPPTATTLSGLQVVDDTTFTVTLSRPEAEFALRLGDPAFFPLPASALADVTAFGEEPVGNGPYMLASRGAWEHGAGIDLVPNPRYEGPRRASNAGLSLVFYRSQEDAYDDLVTGRLDVLDTVPAAALGDAARDLGEGALNRPTGDVESLTVPAGLQHFTGPEGALRRAAISRAIDRQAVVEEVFSGARTPSRDFTSPVVDGWTQDLPGSDVLTTDEGAAQQLWAQADAMSPWAGTFAIAYNSDGGHQPWVDAVAQQIARVLGIQALSQSYPTFAELNAAVDAGTVAGAFRALWQPDYPATDDYLSPRFATGAGSNDTGYSSPELDALLEQARAATTVSASTEILRSAQGVLLRDLPSIPLWCVNAVGGYARGRVRDVTLGWDGVPAYEDVVGA